MRKFNKKNIIVIAAVLLVSVLAVAWFRYEPEDISYTRYEVLLSQNAIQKAKIDDGYVYLQTTQGNFRILAYAIDLGVLSRSIPTTKEPSDLTPFLLSVLLFLVLFVSAFVFFMFRLARKNLKLTQPADKNTAQMLEVGELISEKLGPVLSNVKFSDVAGISDVKIELNEIVDFLKNPAKYRMHGIKMPKGVLMVGPPGVGKTLVAKAVAGEANVPFFYQNGASFVQIYVGVGAKRVRELFARAKALAPSIVFIDEIDAVGKSRGDGRNDEREATLNQLLTEMDGFLDNSGVIVIAATNRIEMIDEALLRAGRFDRRIFLSLPDAKERVEILRSYLRDKNFSGDIEDIAKLSVGFNGAALSTLVNEAAINALRRESDVIELGDFEQVQQKVLFGQKRAFSFSENEKRIQSLYQAAKALSAYWFEVKFEKISLTQERFCDLEHEISSRTQLLSKLKVLLAGVVKLELEYGDVFSNSSEDIAAAKELAQKMVYEYAMGESFLANPSDVEKILRQARDEIAEFLGKMNTQTAEIAQKLFANESIEKDEISKILSKQYE
ncbi:MULTISPECIES: AAA family ATPase [unclassified Campylobacter]|uniref:AAA family ATPase n=1 Tax=unclassified Campylobacter TaxID=2593542 RepID=UPI003D33F3AA